MMYRTIDRIRRRPSQQSLLIIGKQQLINLKKILMLENLVMVKPVNEKQLVDEFSDLSRKVQDCEKKKKDSKMDLSKLRRKESDAKPLEQAINMLKEERDCIIRENNEIQERIQSLNKSVLHYKCTIHEHEAMKALTKATREENQVLKKEHKRLTTENDTLQQKVLKCEAKRPETEVMKRETEQLRAKVKELKREVIIRRTDYEACLSASSIGTNVLYERGVLITSVRRLQQELTEYPNVKPELEQVKRKLDRYRMDICLLYSKLQEHKLMLEDRRATKGEFKYLQKEEEAQKEHMKYLARELNKAKRKKIEQEVMEDKIEMARNYNEQLTRKRQALLQEMEQLSGLMTTNKVVEAMVHSQRSETRAEITQIQSLQDLLKP